MLTITRDINVYAQGQKPIVNLSQYDDDFRLVFRLYTSNGTFTMPDGTTAQIQGTKTDGNGYSAAASVSGNTVTVAGHVQMTAAAGPNVFEIVTFYNNKRLSTINFILAVERAALDSDTVSSESVIKDLSNIPAAVEQAEAAADRAEEAARTLTIDSTLTQSGQAADAKVTGDEIADLKEDLNTFDCTPLLLDGYTGTSGTKIGAFHESSSYKTCVLSVLPGDVVLVKGYATDAARVWAFADADRTITRRADFAVINPTTLTVADGERFLVYNDAVEGYAARLTLTINRIATIESIQSDIVEIHDEITEINSAVDAVSKIAMGKPFKNNLRTDGIETLIPFGVTIYKNGSASADNYGEPGAKYVLNIGTFDKCHVRFRYRDTTYRPYSGENVFVSVASLGSNNALNLKELYQSVSSQRGQIYRTSGHYPANQDAGSTQQLNPQYRTPLNGENAIAIFYNGNVTSESVVSATFTSESIALSVDGVTAGTVALTATDTIQDLADAISDISGFSCLVKNGDGTVNDLLLPASETISFVSTATRSGSTIYGTQPILIPFKVSKFWHLCEIMADKTNQEAFVAYDGITSRVGFGSAKALTNGVLVLGGSYTTESGIEICDLEIDVDTYADCELVYGPITNASTEDTRQLISDKNPRLLIFEGHGIFIGSEADAYAAYQQSGSSTSQEAMAVSTERLNIVFETLKARGYQYVTMREIIAWKSGLMDLPKRCYTMIFDDYRIENFLDYDKRKPFVKAGAKPALAMVSGKHALSETIEANGETYAIGDALDMINLNGWYMCSHTYNHRYCGQYTISELTELLKTDVLSCDKHKMHGDIIVYPYGDITPATLKAVAESDFALGISIVEECYNCAGTNPYRLTRTELGTRASLERVLAPFI